MMDNIFTSIINTFTELTSPKTKKQLNKSQHETKQTLEPGGHLIIIDSLYKDHLAIFTRYKHENVTIIYINRNTVSTLNDRIKSYNKRWESVNVFMKTTENVKRKTLHFFNIKISVNPLIMFKDPRAQFVISMLRNIDTYTKKIYIFAQIDNFSDEFKKLIIRANNSMHSDIVLSDVSSYDEEKENKNKTMCSWSVRNGYLTLGDDDNYINHAKINLFNDSYEISKIL